MKKIIFIIALLLTQSLFAKSNFDKFGGEVKLKKIVNEFTVKLQNNVHMKAFFKETDIKRFQEKLYEQFCSELGGPCKYTGKNMKRSHKGHEINQNNFYKLVEILQETMSENEISNSLQNKLLKKLAPMYKDIVNN